jgi:hypothetical protein
MNSTITRATVTAAVALGVFASAGTANARPVPDADTGRCPAGYVLQVTTCRPTTAQLIRDAIWRAERDAANRINRAY